MKMFLATLLVIMFNAGSVRAESPFVAAGGLDQDGVVVELLRSLDEITAKEVNEFHLRCIALQMESESPGFQPVIRNGGVVVRSFERNEASTAGASGAESTISLGLGKGVIPSSVGNPLHWTLEVGGEVVIEYWISIRETSQTILKVDLDRRPVFVNVSHVDGMEMIDKEALVKPIVKLGGLSPTAFLQRLRQMP